MKESKISLLLLVSLSMLLLAFVVLFIWGFTYYRQSISATQSNTIVVKDSSAIAGNIRDSLQKMYTNTINKLNVDLDSTRTHVDSFQLNMDAKMAEFNNLKTEISSILQNSPSSSDLIVARQKIQDLQKKLEDWRSKFADVSEENKRLSQLLQQLTENVNSSNPSIRKTPAGSTMLPEKQNTVASFVITDFQLRAIMQLDDKEMETYQALQTDEFRGSIELKNNTASQNGAELFIVVLQPDGKVMKQSTWETGMFETKEGRKIYSCKMHFDYLKGENKRLNFSIAADKYPKGNYIMQLYHNGILIARATKNLS
jgi:predicted  nucleic acid-binding Zn-ribbon protein